MLEMWNDWGCRNGYWYDGMVECTAWLGTRNDTMRLGMRSGFMNSGMDGSRVASLDLDVYIYI